MRICVLMNYLFICYLEYGQPLSDPERDRRHMSYNTNYQKHMTPQHMRHPQGYPQMGGHQRYPNYPYPAYVVYV